MKVWLVIVFTFLLSGCAYHGVMPEMYDGEPIVSDSDALAEYRKDARIKNVDERRYPYIHASRLTTYPAFTDDDFLERIEPGTYRDFEPGWYSVMIGGEVSSSALVVYDETDVRVFETSLIGSHNTAYIYLNEGDYFEFKTRYGTAEVERIEAVPVGIEEDSLFLRQGMYVIGETLDAGRYRLLTEELLVMRNDNTPEVYWNVHGASFEYMMERGTTDDYKPDEIKDKDHRVRVTLNEGDVLIVQKVTALKED